MTIRAGFLAFLVALAMTVGAMGAFAGLWPLWQREARQFAAERDRFAAQAESLTDLAGNLQATVRSTEAGKAQVEALLASVSVEARDKQQTLQDSLADLQRQMGLKQDDLAAYRQALAEEQAGAEQNATSATQQLTALRQSLRQSGAREAALQNQIVEAQRQMQSAVSSAADERERLLTGLRAAESELARLRDAWTAQQTAADDALRQVAVLQEELRKSRLREQVMADHLENLQRRHDDWERRGRQADGFKSDNERLQRDLAALQEENKKLRAENAELRRQLAGRQESPSTSERSPGPASDRHAPGGKGPDRT